MSQVLAAGELLRDANFVAGRWSPSLGGARYDVANPATDEIFATVPDSTAADARAAVDAAAAAFPAWRALPARDRARLLRRWHDLLLANADELARLIGREMGKPFAEARGEVEYGASYVQWFAEEAVRVYGDVIAPAVTGRQMLAIKEPVGIVAAITPWNFPVAMIARKIAPALAAGCVVVAKPAEDTPLSALALARLAEAAGIPAGVLNIVTASRSNAPAVVDVWLADARVRKITFTGSTAVGKHLARESAATLKKITLELGGNAPFIVFDDADLETAVAGLMKAKFRAGGQTCVSPNRIYVQAGIHDAFAKRLAEEVVKLQVGRPEQPGTQIGPLINARAVAKVERHVQDALQHGARALAGGQRLQSATVNGSNYFTPTVLAGATRAMAVFHEETFGPVVPLFRFDSEEEVVAAANDTPFGLAAYFFTRDAARIWRLSRALESGVIGINEGAFASEAAPFGGIKESGYGREGSRYGLDDYLHIKYLCQGGLS